MKTRSAKAKGRRLAERIRQMMLDLAPSLSPDDIFVNTSSNNGEDILFSSAARELWPFSVECKNRETINIWAAIAQAESHAKGTNHIPLVVFSRNHSKDYVVLEAETFFKNWATLERLRRDC